jgi:poly(hydroxyalkanoate) depolymerase family esterase
MSLRSAVASAMRHLARSDVAAATTDLQRVLFRGLEPRSAPSAPAPATPSKETVAAAPARLAPLAPAGSLQEGSRSKTGEAAFVGRIHQGPAGGLHYKLYVAASAVRGEASLIVMLHGCTQDPDDFARGTRMNALAEEHGLIVAYPAQARGANPQGCWNWFDRKHQKRGAGEPALIAGLVEEIATEFGVARGRIFAAGLSAGGAMAEVLAATYPELFSAIGVHSGLAYGAATNVPSAFQAMKGKAKPRPAMGPAEAERAALVRKIVLHGSKDSTVAPSNGERIFADAARGGQTQTRTIDANGRRVVVTTANAPGGRAQAEHWVIEGLGHAWSGGDGTGSYSDAAGPDASREMLRFFLG